MQLKICLSAGKSSKAPKIELVRLFRNEKDFLLSISANVGLKFWMHKYISAD